MDDARPGPARRVAVVVGWLALAALLVPVAVRLSGFERGPLAYVVPLVPWVVPAALVPLTLALVARSWSIAGAAATAATVCAVWTAPLLTAETSSGDTVLTVATINLGVGGGDAAAVVAMVRERDVDILSVQELTPAAAEALAAAGLEAELPHVDAWPDERWRGTGLWSRHPFAAGESIPGYTFQQVKATVQAPGGDVTVLAVHPAAPQLVHNRVWREETRALVDLLDAIPGPVIAAGDFNASREHRAFRDLEARGFVDAADQAGAGLVPTFPQDRTSPTIVAIDHVVTRDLGLAATGVEAVVIPGSDHRALVASFARR